MYIRGIANLDKSFEVVLKYPESFFFCVPDKKIFFPVVSCG